MSEAKFTPGEWAPVSDGNGNHYIASDGGDGEILATVDRLEDGVDNARKEREMLANWRLFAAAPALYEACKQWVDYFDNLDAQSDPDDPLAKARTMYHRKRIDATRAALTSATPPAKE